MAETSQFGPEENLHTLVSVLWCNFLLPKDNLFKNIFDFTTAGDWDYVAMVERLPSPYYSVDFIFLSFGLWVLL